MNTTILFKIEVTANFGKSNFCVTEEFLAKQRDPRYQPNDPTALAATAILVGAVIFKIFFSQ